MIRKIRNFIRAVLGNEKVSPELAASRAAICRLCPHLGSKRGQPACSLCGCRIDMLVQYVENLPEWGCKHPDRAAGLGWPGEFSPAESLRAELATSDR
jgi:hypothetical protein